MKHRTKLSQEQQHAETHQSQSAGGHEFASTEELLRFDAAQTDVPAGVAERLKRTSAAALPPKTSWLKRLFN